MNETTPAGFCPKCHYPIDPGICPECGTEVSTDSILSSLSQTRAARIRRWALRIFLFLILPAAALYAAFQVSWPHYMPTGWLLAMQRDAKHWATIELSHRYMAGVLSPTQVDRMINAAWIPLELKLRDQVPFKSPVKCELSGGLRAPVFLDFNLNVGVEHLRVDGRERDAFSTFCHGSCWSRPVVAEGLIYGLSPGLHELVFDLKSYAEDPRTSRKIQIWKGTVSKTVIIVEAPGTDFVTRDCSAELETRSRNAVSLGISGYHAPDIDLSFTNSLPIDVAGHVEARFSGEPEFHSIGNKVIRAGRNGFAYMQLADPERTFSIRIIPDELAAVELTTDVSRILGCPLQWDGLRSPYYKNPSTQPSFPLTPGSSVTVQQAAEKVRASSRAGSTQSTKPE